MGGFLLVNPSIDFRSISEYHVSMLARPIWFDVLFTYLLKILLNLGLIGSKLSK